MLLPRWLFLLVAFWVTAFGVYRIYLAATRDRPRPEGSPSFRQRGLWARSARAHLLYGLMYLVLGGYLIASAYGYGFTLQGGCRGGGTPAHGLGLAPPPWAPPAR